MIRILIADDHGIVRASIRTLVSQHADWHVCGEASDGHEAVELAKRLHPDVAILDVTMKWLNGIEATSQIRKALPRTEVLIFTMHDAEDLVRRALSAGARGYFLKSDTTADLESAIEAVAQHKPYFAPAISKTILNTVAGNGMSNNDAAFGHEPLTAREREIVQLLAEGKSNKQICRLLDLTVATVQTHRATIMRKLDVSSIAELVRYAVRNKIIEP